MTVSLLLSIGTVCICVCALTWAFSEFGSTLDDLRVGSNVVLSSLAVRYNSYALPHTVGVLFLSIWIILLMATQVMLVEAGLLCIVLIFAATVLHLAGSYMVSMKLNRL